MTGESSPANPLVLYSLVAIGASAGGIEAISVVLGALPKDFPIPIVVAQHLDPSRPSHLDAILARRTALTVRLVTDVAPLLPATVYVVPSDRDIEITDHEVHVQASNRLLPNPSINRLFASAARAYGERLIAAILTGTGSDGTQGAREVKAAGGLVMIENPMTAAFGGMPRSLAPTNVDIVADLKQIGPLLSELVAGSSVLAVPLSHSPDQSASWEEDELLASLLAEVRQQSGVDFSGYRRATILRRLQRRMVVTKSPRMEDYQRYLVGHPEEYHLLVSSFLIKVTEFFRDPEFFRALRERVLPELIAESRLNGNQLRLWSAGCATGEEAYSLALLVAEALGPELGEFTVRIFATDLDERAVAFARQAIYPAAALAAVPQEIRDRYFIEVDGAAGAYEVNKRIRNLITFGEHDLGQRPPFPRIDLVLCRNVLIYFTSEMQQRALSLFAYALRPGGYLVLGKAESARAMADYLVQADPDLKLYRRVGKTLLPPLLVQSTGTFSTPHPVVGRVSSIPSAEHGRPSRDKANDSELVRTGRAHLESEHALGWHAQEPASHLVDDLPFGVVIVDRRYHIQTINGAALRLLDIYRPAINEDLVHVAERVPSQALRSIIDAVFQPIPSEEASSTQGSGGVGGLREPHTEARVLEVVTLQTGLGERRDIEITSYPYAPRHRGASAASQVKSALLLVSDVTSAVAARAAAELATAHNRSVPAQALEQQDKEVDRLRAQVDQMMIINRQLVEANQELGRANLEVQGVNDEVLLAQEQEQASVEEIRTLTEELQASNEELETVNEELEATVEELHNSNEDLEASSREARELANTAQRQHHASEAEQARLAAILLSLGDAVLVVDPDGIPLVTNLAYAHLFGTSSIPFAAQDAEGHPLLPEERPQQRAARGETFIMEFTLEGDDGTRRYFEATGQPIRSSGDSSGGVLAIRNTSERSLHRFQDEFLALASHELRTPLTPLLTYLQLLEKLFAHENEFKASSQASTYLAGALHQVQHLRRLIQDIVDVRRLQNGSFSLETGRVSLNLVVDRSIAEARISMRTGQTIKLTQPESTLLVDADAMRLEQVIMNLLGNAVTYAARSPEIEVRLRPSGDEAILQVKDTGPGIPAADLPHIFRRFYQSTSATEKPSRRGLGLGLYIAHGLVAAHGGRLEVSSVMAPSPDHGSTFTIHLPIAPGGVARKR